MCESPGAVRICLAYDCLYPYTVGGAERWYRNLAAELVAEGHEVTYLTRRQWPRGERPHVPGVRVVVVAREDDLYVDGRRRIDQALRFGRGVFGHLARHRGRYDVVHLCAFPYFSLIGARAALIGTRVPVGVDWFEVWSHDYWRGYLGGLAGMVGELVQRLCVRLTPTAFVFSRLHGARLAAEGTRGEVVRLGGLYTGPLEAEPDLDTRVPSVVFAGRHIPEKQAELVPEAVVAARELVPGLEGDILGDGPTRGAVMEEIERTGAGDFVRAPGFVEADAVHRALARATCNVLPSSREGYGLVVIEAAALGTPSVVLAGLDNAAVELIEEGVNGFVAATPADLPAAIAAVHDGGQALRRSTARWFGDRVDDLTAVRSARTIARVLEEQVALSR